VIVLADVQDVAHKIDLATGFWPGNCHSIAALMLDRGLVPNGKLRYGNWLGPIAPGTEFAGRHFPHHGWIEELDPEEGILIADPTRWVFEGKKPYIYHAPDFEGWYDMGGNVYRKMFKPDPPAYDPDDTQVDIPEGIMGTIFRQQLGDFDGLTMSMEQACYVAQAHPDVFVTGALQAYQWFEEHNMRALIPIDNWDYVHGE